MINFEQAKFRKYYYLEKNKGIFVNFNNWVFHRIHIPLRYVKGDER